MHILVGWNTPEEAALLQAYLGVDENQVVLCSTAESLVGEAKSGGPWDAVLISTELPDEDAGFEAFRKVQELLPEVPIVGAVPVNDVYRIARFLTNGLRGYLIRDTAGDFIFLAQSVIEAAVKSVEAERERVIAAKLREEIESVRQLQASIIPQSIQCPPGYSVAARYESSQIRVIGGRPVTMAGGDYYDVFLLPNGHLALIVGDASGHGMKACLSIMTMHTLIRMIRDNRFKDTSEFVAQVNRNLCEQTIVSGEGGFITLVYGVLNPHSHTVTWSSAGHPVPLLHRLDTDEVEPVADQEAPGLPLGILPDADYTEHSFQVPSNSRVLLYTDGIIEAFPLSDSDCGRHQEFGEEGLKQTLRDVARVPLEDSLQRLFDASLEFTGGEGRHDDTSVVLLERVGTE